MTGAPFASADPALLLDEPGGDMPDAPFATRRAEARPFALGRDSFRPAQHLTGLERMGEKLARALKPALEPILRGRIGVSTTPLETIDYREWQARLPAFMSLSLYRLHPLKGGMLIAIDPDFIARLVESFYGGAPGAHRPTRATEFTPSEELLLRRLLDRLSGVLVQHWDEVVPVDAAPAGQESNAHMLNFVRPHEAVVIQRFAIASDAGDAEIQILYPLAMLRPLEEKLATSMPVEDTDAVNAWRRRLGQALQDVTLPVRSVLARPEISVAQLLALKPGDVVPITLPSRAPLLAGAQRIALGVIGEQDGRAALMIEKVGQL
ncbi:flagellar motor switch protein FliM [Sphingomonas sp.]|uniref:flagellar motor switch protein FliM n=1 Tax=Sphingomonas sp. TaxID=28214 RepID=UPI003B3A5544